MGKKCCCNKLPCCCGNSPRQWIVDLSAGGWTDGRCNQCNEVQGEFTLDHNTSLTGHELTCLFTYCVDDWCEDSLAGDCTDVPPETAMITFCVILRIPLMNEFVSTCTITASVSIGDHRGEDAFCEAQCRDTYEGTFVKADFDGCFDEDFVPFMLTRTGNICTANNNLGLLCNGILPATITIRPAT